MVVSTCFIYLQYPALLSLFLNCGLTLYRSAIMCHPVPIFFLSSVWQTFSLQRQQDAPTKAAHCRGDFARFPRWRGTDQNSSFLRVSDNRRSMIIYTTNIFINLFISFHIHICHASAFCSVLSEFFQNPSPSCFPVHHDVHPVQRIFSTSCLWISKERMGYCKKQQHWLPTGTGLSEVRFACDTIRGVQISWVIPETLVLSSLSFS